MVAETIYKMDVIIDGYNLLGADQGLQGALDHRRDWLVQQLSRYQNAKGFAVTVVFDGWKSGRPNEVNEKVNGVSVIYSRQGEKADDVVVRVARLKGSGCAVVSSDREVRNGVEKFGAAAIYAGEFNKILRQLDDPGSYSNDCEAESSRSRDAKRLSKTERRRQDRLNKLRLD